MAPSEKMSARRSTVLALRICSGDMYAGVPMVVPLRVVVAVAPASSLMSFASPKSLTFGTRPRSVMAHRMFAGLRSRWISPARWAADMPAKMPSARSSA